MFLGKVQQPQPDPAVGAVGGERHLPGKRRGDRTARCLAAGRRPAAAAAPTQMVAPVSSDAVPTPDPVTGVIAATSVFGADDLGLPPFEPGAGSGGFDGLPPMAPPGGGFEPPERQHAG